MSLCLIIDNNGSFRNYPYIGEYSATDNCWHGQDNSYLPFHPAQKVVYLKSIKNFQTFSNCKTFPPEHKIYLVKRYVEKRIRTLLNDKNNYVFLQQLVLIIFIRVVGMWAIYGQFLPRYVVCVMSRLLEMDV